MLRSMSTIGFLSVKGLQMFPLGIHRHADDTVHTLPHAKIYAFLFQLLIRPAVARSLA